MAGCVGRMFAPLLPPLRIGFFGWCCIHNRGDLTAGVSGRLCRSPLSLDWAPERNLHQKATGFRWIVGKAVLKKSLLDAEGVHRISGKF